MKNKASCNFSLMTCFQINGIIFLDIMIKTGHDSLALTND